uniref:Uncharacterized protein n=1 Tax=Mycena chlorophos TaxID=658473 RepID=A0ABQ0LY40_MYCCL|nr:predicted protein [Mycena chlorophos]
MLPWSLLALVLLLPVLRQGHRPTGAATDDGADVCPAPAAPAQDHPQQQQPQEQPPPSYAAYHAYERALPQHTGTHPPPRQDALPKMLWFDNHGSHFGWGNYMQEMILNAYLAHAAGRAYVWDNYTWSRDGPEISDWNGHRIPARIPLSALIAGPIVGGEAPGGSPRAVSREWYFEVCTEEQRVKLDTRKFSPEWAEAGGEPPNALQIVERWVVELRGIDAPCVEMAWGTPALFSYELTNEARVLPIFPSLSSSPILSSLRWSPLIQGAFLSNAHHFGFGLTPHLALIAVEDPLAPIKGLLVLHIRRGDYEEWCPGALANGITYVGFNRFPELPDRSPGVREEGALAHCLPDVEEVVRKVRSVVRDAEAKREVRQVYIMTNAHPPWLAQLVTALREHALPESVGISTSRDLSLSWEAKFVSQAVDMLVGQRAEMFIGNGYSSLTGNIVMLRMHNERLDPKDTRFW